ncbi:MAG TPA: CHAT domain-containing protein [Acidimicrobiales bacterium]|nr:CHAT domain-containing protein [Acidimicrobiales bacterium]
MAPTLSTELSSLSLHLASEDPDRAEQLAIEARDRAVEAGLPAAESTALRALGVAARSRHRIPEALVHLRAAVQAAERAGDVNLAAEARLSLAGALVLAGNGEEAISTLDGAGASGATAVAVESQRAMVLAMLGRYEEALKAYRQVIPGLRRSGDRVREGRALNNRGLLHMYNGRFGLAEADLARAERLMLEIGNPTEAARFCHNRGSAAARKGDLPTALALFEEADRRCREVGVDQGPRGLNRARALVAAGLFHDSRQVAEEAIEQLREGGNQQDLAEGLVLLADTALLGGDPMASRAAADEAAKLFEHQKRPGWQALAEAAVARAGLAQADDHSHGPLAGLATAAAAQLEQMGLSDRAVMAHAVAGRLWLAAGDFAAGVAELDRAGSKRRRGTAAGRLAAWEAEGVARLARGDRRGAMAAMRRALAVVNDQQANLAATELRANIASHAGDAARQGLRLALDTRRASCIWQWMELHRANSLQPLPVRPPRDEVLAAHLAELRRLGQDIAACATSGDDPAPLLGRQSEVERQVRERAWQRGGAAAASSPAGRTPAPGPPGRGSRPPKLADLFDALGPAALVEFADVDGQLHAVVAAAGTGRHRHLGDMAEVRRELGHVRLALRRLAYGGAHAALGAGAEAQLARAVARLDRLLMMPIAPFLGSRPVVVVPTGELHATPWAALPTLGGRPIAVAPSARLWLRATSNISATWTTSIATTARTASTVTGSSRPSRRRRQRTRRRTIVVAGPRLSGAEHEAVLIGSLHDSAEVLTGPGAEAAAVLGALEGAGIAHVAAHASFRADNGLWSSLELADGVLTVYELEQLRRPPELVVLSACQSGLSSVRPGDEVMGLVAALLTLGAGSVVASVVPVEDRASEDLMVAFHQRLLAGDRPAAALAGAQAVTPGTVGLSYACFGGG